MKNTTKYIVLSLSLTFLIQGCVTSGGNSRTLTILGGETITAQFEGNIPVPVESNGIKIEVAGLMKADEGIIDTFGFTSRRKLNRVIIEEVTGENAVILVVDDNPLLRNNYWMGSSEPRRVTRDETPWVYEDEDTLRIFRITVWLDSRIDPVVLYQPSVIARDSKPILR